MGCIKCMVVIAIVLPLSAVLIQWINSVDVESYYKNKRIIITGASEGIGKELAIRLSQLGSRLVIAARTESKLKETQKLCQQYSPDVFVVKADVGKKEDTKLIVDETIKRLGGIDILILNAAYSPPPSMFLDYSNPDELFLDVYKVNVLQSVYLTQFSMDHLRESHGTILAVSSMTGWIGAPKFSAYVASKHALQGYFSSLNMEFEIGQENVSIVMMPLGFIYTQRAVESMQVKPNLWFEPGVTTEDCVERMVQGLPLKKLYYYITWDTHVIGHLYSLCPYCFDYFGTIFMQLFCDAI